MAGLLGIAWHKNADAIGRPHGLVKALAVARHTPNTQSRILLHSSTTDIGALYHERDPAALHVGTCGATTVYIYGQIGENPQAPLNLKAGDIAAAYLKNGLVALNQLSGSYLLVLLDQAAGCVILQNDRQGNLPWFSALGGDWFSFAPEAKCIFQMAPLEPHLDVNAAIAFLREGFPLPGSCLFRNIRRFQPGQRIRIDLDSFLIHETRYWDLTFKPDQSLTLPDAVSELYQQVLRGHERLTRDEPASFGVFLTGGVDSRGIAASLARIHRPPALTLTWCGKPGVPNSDPVIAQAIARHFNYAHSTVVVDPQAFHRYAREWLYISELVTDNMGFFIAPVDVFSGPQTAGLKYFLVGDELFGHGSRPVSFDAAVRYILKSFKRPIRQWLRGCVRLSAVESIEQLFDDEVANLVAAIKSANVRDIVDLMTFYVHRPCWSYSAGHCKEPGFPVRRPYMQDAIIDFVAQLPESFRNDKTVYYEMLRRLMPEALQFSRTTADSLFNWSWEFRNQTATGLLLMASLNSEALLDGPLREIIDFNQTSYLVKQYFLKSDSLHKKHFYGHYAVNVRRWLGKFTLTRPLVQAASSLLRQGNASAQLEMTHLIRRLALLGLFIDAIDQGVYAASVEVEFRNNVHDMKL